LGIGFGVFKKMDPTIEGGQEVAGFIELRDNMLINLGEAYIVVNLVPDDASIYDKLRLKIFGGVNNGEIYDYSVSDMVSDKKVIIGRTLDCDIVINDKLLSKI
jgi:hypothetical protein